jgi:hypothetical protein
MIITDVQDGLDEGRCVLGIRERPEAGGRGLIFIEGAPDGDEDDDLEMDSYCLVADPSQAVFYGGVERCEIHLREGAGPAGPLRLTLDQETAEELEVPRSAQFDLHLTAGQLDVLRRGLRRILTSGRPSAIPELLGL